jgi:hypothetical protein
MQLLLHLHSGSHVWKAFPLPWSTQEGLFRAHCRSLESLAFEEQNGLWRPRNLCGVLVYWQMMQEASESQAWFHLLAVCHLDETEWFTLAPCLSYHICKMGCKCSPAKVVVKCVCEGLSEKAHSVYHQVCIECFGVWLLLALSLIAYLLKLWNIK